MCSLALLSLVAFYKKKKKMNRIDWKSEILWGFWKSMGFNIFDHLVTFPLPNIGVTNCQLGKIIFQYTINVVLIAAKVQLINVNEQLYSFKLLNTLKFWSTVHDRNRWTNHIINKINFFIHKDKCEAHIIYVIMFSKG